MEIMIYDRASGTGLWAEVYERGGRVGYLGAYYLRTTRDRLRVRAVGLWPREIQGRPGPARETIDEAIEAAVAIYVRAKLLPLYPEG